MAYFGKKLTKFWEFGSGRTTLAAFCAHTISISIGICQGYSAILLPQLAESKEFNITDDQSSWLASLGAITNPVGSVLSGVLAEYLGRKRSIQISCLPFLVGWICIGFARDINWLYAGRLITGIAAGMSTACYTYVSEIATPERRGLLQALGPICASFGIWLTYTAGYCLRWSTVAFVSLAFALFTLVAMEFLPESPAFYMRKNRTQQAFESCVWFRRSNVVAQQEIDKFGQFVKSKGGSEGCSVYFQPQTVKPFFILVLLFLLQELSGIYTILFYAVNFFQETNLDIDNYVSSIIVGWIRFTMSLLGALLINRFGRKVLCVSSSCGMAAAMLTVASYMKYYELHPGADKIFPYLPLVGIILNVVFSMVGMLPIPWILVGELFPLEVRPIMSGVVICLAQTFIFLCVKIYNDLLLWLSFSGTLFLFSVAAVLAILFSWIVLPETKNKSLEEIEEHFIGNQKCKKEICGFDNKGFVLQNEDKCKRGFTLSV